VFQNDEQSSQHSKDRLALLYHLSQTFNSSLDLDEVLNRVMDEVIRATHAERGFVMLQEEDGLLLFRVARGIDQQTIGEPQFQVSRSVVERVAHEGQPILTSDAQSDARFSMRQSVMILGLRSILCVPLMLKDRNLGAIYVDNRMQAGIFSQSDLELLTAIASSAAIAIENARLYQIAVEKGRLERELQVARQVQAGLLPQDLPQLPGWEFIARWRPARQVAGDYYDIILHEDGRLSLVIADVTDKGMPAALFMALTRSFIRASMDLASSPAQGILHANRLICADSTNGMFVTLFYALLDPATGDLTYVNAGHNPPLLFSAGSDQPAALRRTGMALGVEVETSYEQNTLRLQPGDFIVLYTDGVVEAIDTSQQEFGIQRLQQVLLDNRNSTPSSIVQALEQDLIAFTGPTPPFDDITLLFAKRQETDY
jgi:sigma-B regulation protein RsbU (phosphoserine phosphatase)